MSEIVISTENLHKFYGLKDQQVHALRGVDISIGEGEIVGVMGPSGCGKTTLLNCLSGLDSFDDGNILIQGKSLREQSDDQLSEFRAKKMGFVFQTYNLLPVLTAVENVELPLLVSGFSGKEARSKAIDKLAEVDLENQQHQLPGQLSGGQRQRLSIARALVKDAPILILDEATSALDSESEIEVQQAIEHLMENRTTIVIAHRLSTIRNANRICVMENGEIVEQGNHDELLLKEGRYQQLYEMQFKDQPNGSGSEKPKVKLVS